MKWVWIVALGLAWPFLLYFYGGVQFGFGNPDTSYLAALRDFGLLGLLSGWVLFYFLERTNSGTQRTGQIVGYVLFIPLGFALGFAGGFLLTFVGAAVLGSLAEALGTWLGGLVGARLRG
jgi:hypothetical protein